MLFRSRHNIEWLNKKNKEIVERVVGEKITYYAISKEFTRENVYGESREKVFSPPVEVIALVKWKEQDVVTDKFGQDVSYNISFYPLLSTLENLNLSPREGDYVEYDSQHFEITKITYPKQMLGKESESFYVNLDCVTVRKGIFHTSISGSPDDAKRTRPDNNMSASFSYDDVLFPFSSSI